MKLSKCKAQRAETNKKQIKAYNKLLEAIEKRKVLQNTNLEVPLLSNHQAR